MASYNLMRQKLAQGEVVLGVGIRLVRTGEIAKIMQAAGFDWIWSDLEHSALSLDQASQISLAAIDAGQDWSQRLVRSVSPGIGAPGAAAGLVCDRNPLLALDTILCAAGSFCGSSRGLPMC